MATSLNTSSQNVGGTTSPARFVPEDQEARDLIANDLDRTFFVEASAGTGKTTSLVQRMINLVQSGRTTMDRVAAITFTEAAAAELQERVRQGLERAADNGALSTGRAGTLPAGHPGPGPVQRAHPPFFCTTVAPGTAFGGRPAARF